MELAASLIPIICSPACAFVDPETFGGTSKDEPILPAQDYRLYLNELRERFKSPQWRIDGSGGGGTQFFIIPLFTGPKITPLRIDLFIPDQKLHSPELRTKLQSSVWYPHGNSSNIYENSEIFQYLLIALETWSSKQHGLEDRFESLPFGSQIIIPELVSNPTKVEMYISPGHQVERKLYSLATLKLIYDLPPDVSWPSTIDIQQLDLQKQIQDNISLVLLRDDPSSDLMIFKSSLNDFDYLYHELYQLLSLTPHHGTIHHPTHLVTKKCRFGGKTGVVGFLLPYYAGGDLGQTLSHLAAMDMLCLPDQFKWARQVTASLLHVRDSGTYYSDLRPDNLLLSSSKDIILIDFEQRGNWYSWVPPEVRYIQYLQTLSAGVGRFRSHVHSSDTSLSIPTGVRSRFEALLQRSGRTMAPLSRSGFPEVVDHSNAWRALTPDEQESAMVSSLGKLLWCLFEGVGSLPGDFWGVPLSVPGLRFPDFRRTPEEARRLILDCTVGESEHWRQGPGASIANSRLVPSDEILIADGRTVVELFKRWWEKELEDMQSHFETKVRFPTRPSLKDVSQRLELICDRLRAGIETRI